MEEIEVKKEKEDNVGDEIHQENMEEVVVKKEEEENVHVESSNDESTTTTVTENDPNIEDKLSEKTEQAETDIENFKYDTQAWKILFSESTASSDKDRKREIFKRFLQVFPSSGQHWKRYVEFELKDQNYEAITEIFKQCLVNTPHIDLWKTYIKFVRATHKGEEKREEVIKAFEFALSHMGFDPNAAKIWTEYISFLKAIEPKNQHEEIQKMTAIRKVYQRAVGTPIHNLETLWKEYDAFERNTDEHLAKGLTNQHASRYMAARTMYRERKGYLDGIDRNMLAVPRKHGSSRHERQLYLWRRLIEYESSNPQRLDDNPLHSKIMFTYNQALLCLYHYPEIWYEAITREKDMGNMEGTETLFKRSIKAMPTSSLLHFAYADFLESQKRPDDARAVFEKLKEISTDPLAHIQCMRLIRRTQGIDASRKIFMASRKSSTCTYHVYVASALMEHFVNKKPDIARNIFKKGMELFINEPAFVLEYMNFLTHMNEDKGLRTIFERVVNTADKSKTAEVWKKYVDFAYIAGTDLETISKLEERKREAFPSMDTSGFLTLVNRYKFMDLWPCDRSDLTGSSTTKATKVETPKEHPSLARYPRPDLSKMVPYTPEMAAAPPQVPPIAGSSGGGGGGPIAIPRDGGRVHLYAGVHDIIMEFLEGLPPASVFNEIPPDVDAVIALIRDTPLPDQSKVVPKKRRVESTNDGVGPTPPPSDIFRRRQAAKMMGKHT